MNLTAHRQPSTDPWEDEPTVPGRRLELAVLALPDDPHLLEPEETARYLDAAYPCPLDLEVERLLTLYVHGGGRTRACIASTPLATSQVWLLLRYAERMALRAFVGGETSMIRLGLTAIEVLGSRAAAARIAPVRLMLHRAASAIDPT